MFPVCLQKAVYGDMVSDSAVVGMCLCGWVNRSNMLFQDLKALFKYSFTYCSSDTVCVMLV